MPEAAAFRVLSIQGWRFTATDATGYQSSWKPARGAGSPHGRAGWRRCTTTAAAGSKLTDAYHPGDHTTQPDSPKVEFVWRDEAARKGSPSYSYLRAEQCEGELVWVSPMWIKYE